MCRYVCSEDERFGFVFHPLSIRLFLAAHFSLVMSAKVRIERGEKRMLELRTPHQTPKKKQPNHFNSQILFRAGVRSRELCSRSVCVYV